MNNIAGLENIPSPSLLLFPNRIGRNIDLMISIVDGKLERLRPHVKTHKLGEVIQMQLKRGIDRVKCATPAEVEMAAKAGAKDLLLAYQPVGPNIDRLIQLQKDFPDSQISALVDDLSIFRQIAEKVKLSGAKPFTLLIDLDCGMHRTGIEQGDKAVALVQEIVSNPVTEFGGIHAYDGHIHDAEMDARIEQFTAARKIILEFAKDLTEAGISIPKIVAGGSPTFGLHAKQSSESEIPWECSPGTTLLWDAGYGEHFPDLPFELGAALLTRVISKPGDNYLCLDLGHKSVSAENPISHRVRIPAIPDAEFVSQSEEHLVIAVKDPAAWQVGDTLIGIPYHICPSLALHEKAHLIRDNKVTTETWTIHARNR